MHVPSGAGDLWAPIYLPSGAGIGYVGLYAFDNDAASSVQAHIGRFTGYGSKECIFQPCPAPVPPLTETILSVATVGTPGYRYEESSGLFPLHSVNNDTAYGNGGQYIVVVAVPASPGLHLMFKGVDVWWKRQIAPPPATATFTDVPVGSQFFAENRSDAQRRHHRRLHGGYLLPGSQCHAAADGRILRARAGAVLGLLDGRRPTSARRCHGGDDRLNVRCTKSAICARVTDASGQYRRGDVVQPSEMPYW